MNDDNDFEDYGDPRRCPRHPGQVTSSSDGLFDAPCAECEAEAEADIAEAIEASAMKAKELDDMRTHAEFPSERGLNETGRIRD